MTTDKLRAYVSKTRAYLASPQGQINTKGLQTILGWSRERIVAEAVMYCCRLVIYERIAEVTNAILEESWQ